MTPWLPAPNFAPNPPPVNSQTTRTLLFGKSKSVASSSCTLWMPWVLS